MSEWKSDQMPTETVSEVEMWLRQWTRDMSVWAKRVRGDILRLENVTGLSEGDPGDPPAGPPE